MKLYRKSDLSKSDILNKWPLTSTLSYKECQPLKMHYYYEQIYPYITIEEWPTSLYDRLDKTVSKAALLRAQHQSKKYF